MISRLRPVDFVALALTALLVGAVLFPVFMPPREGRDRRRSILSNTKSVSMTLQVYLQDYDGTYPRDTRQFEAAVLRYVSNPFLLASPPDRNGVAGVPLRMNLLLGGRKHAEIAQPDRTILLFEGAVYEPMFHYGHDSSRAIVGLANGRCGLMTREEVAKLVWMP